MTRVVVLPRVVETKARLPRHSCGQNHLFKIQNIPMLQTSTLIFSLACVCVCVHAEARLCNMKRVWPCAQREGLPVSGPLRERAASDTFMKQKNSVHVRKKREKFSHVLRCEHGTCAHRHGDVYTMDRAALIITTNKGLVRSQHSSWPFAGPLLTSMHGCVCLQL